MQLVIVLQIIMFTHGFHHIEIIIEIHPCPIYPSFTLKKIYSTKKKKKRKKLLLIYDCKMFTISYHCVNEQQKEF